MWAKKNFHLVVVIAMDNNLNLNQYQRRWRKKQKTNPPPKHTRNIYLIQKIRRERQIERPQVLTADILEATKFGLIGSWPVEPGLASICAIYDKEASKISEVPHPTKSACWQKNSNKAFFHNSLGQQREREKQNKNKVLWVSRPTLYFVCLPPQKNSQENGIKNK